MHDFLIDINPEMELPKYELILYTLNEIPISSLKNITGLNYKEYLLGIDELTFNIPYNRMENNGNIIKNEIYDLVEGDFLIKLNDMKYFIVYDVNEKANAESGEIYKEVKCYSREYELSNKKLINYKADSRMLYDDTNSMLDGLEKGILNYIFNHITKAWKIGYVDIDVILKEGKDVYRALDFPDTNLIQVFEKLQQTFGCIFKFDTVKQEINVYAIENVLGQHRGFYISDRNFIENLSKNIKTDGIITRLYLYGKDNISIQSISPTGQPYIDNFDFYKNTKYMTQNLIDALNNYENKVENYNPNFTPILENLQQANSDMEELLNADHVDDLDKKGLIALERYLSNLQTLIDGKVEELAILKNQISKATGDHLLSLYEELKGVENILESYDEDKEEVNNYILAKEEQISIQQSVIDGIKQQLLVLQNELNMHTNFTEEQLKELDKFIKIETYNNADYTEYNIQELYEEGKKMLQRVSQPSIQFDLNVVDFLNVVECQHVWNKLVLGDIVTIEHKKIGFSHDVKLVQCEHDVDNHTLNLKFSNKNSFDDATLYLQELLEDFKATGTTVDFNKGKWEQVGEVESRIAKIVDSELEKARQNILNAVGQKYLHDDSGLWLYKENPDGTLSNEQIRAINNTIALTKDNWNTVSTAITPEGIIGETIVGKLGTFAKVNAEQIEVGGWQGEYIEDNLKEYVDNQDNTIKDYIDNISDDLTGMIDSKIDTWFYEGEPTLSNPPASAWTTSAIRDKHIGDLYFNTTSGYTFRFKKVGTVYSWERIKDKDIVDAMTKASQAQDTADGKRTIFTSQPTPPYSVGDLWRVIDIEGVDFKICITARATGSFLASHWVNVDKAKGYIDSQVDELDTAIGGLQTNIDNFGKDLKLTATEASTIKMDLERVTYESTDIINIATSLGITTEKNNYTAALNTLTNYLNLYWLNATYPLDITQAQINNVTTHFKYLDDRKTKLINKISEVRTQSVTVHQIILSNENQSIVTDSNGVLTALTEVQSNIDVFRGITKVSATIGTPILKNKDGNTITFGTITKSNPTSVSSGNVKWSILNNTNISSESGWIEIPIIAEGVSYTKKLTWNKARAGSPGSPGSPGADGRPGSDGQDGAPAKIVTVAPSHSAFISKNMDNPNLRSSFEPQNITITPNFQNCTYSKWEYSRNGETWTQITRTTTSTTLPWINSSSRVLTIPRLWSVYSSTQNFVIFKVTSTTGEYDLITIHRLFDSTTLAENALKQNFYYNRTKITESEGIEVYDNLGNKVLQMGGFDSDGNGTKDKYGFVASHNDGTISAITSSGLLKKSAYGESYYLNDIETFIGSTIYQGHYDIYKEPLPCKIYLPIRFRGKNIKTFLSLNDYELFPCDQAWYENNEEYAAFSTIRTELEVIDSNTNVTSPYVDVKGFSKHMPWGQRSGAVAVYGIVTFLLTVIAN